MLVAACSVVNVYIVSPAASASSVFVLFISHYFSSVASHSVATSGELYYYFLIHLVHTYLYSGAEYCYYN